MRRLRQAARSSILYRPYVRWKYRLVPRARQAYFAGMYEDNIWGDRCSRSGSGSNLENTATLRKELPGLLVSLQVRSLLDLPCGDWAWMREVDLTGLDAYIGGDIVPDLIERLNRDHADHRVRFAVLDAISSAIPATDAVMVRDLFGHLEHAQVRRAIANIKRGGATWLLATHYPRVEENLDVVMGAWRPQNFLLTPYRWPAPHAMIWEEPVVERRDKTLAAWRLADL